MLHRHTIIFLALSLVSTLACQSEPEEGAKPAAKADGGLVALTPAQVASAGLHTATIEARQVEGTLRLPGTLALDPSRSWRVSPAVEGIVEQVGVAAHDAVRKGQVLARLRSAALGEAQAAWLEAHANLNIASANRDRTLELRKKAVVSEARWLEVDAESQRATAALAQASHRLSVAGMSPQQVEALEAAGTALGQLTLTSPADGIVLASAVTRGQTLAAGTDAFEIANLSELWVTIHIPVTSLALVKPGAKATAHVAGSRDAGWNGVVQTLGGMVDANDQTVEGRIVVANTDGFLRPGMYAEVEVAAPPVEALMVPTSAVFNVGNQAHVFQEVVAGKYKPLSITAGQPVGEWTPIVGPEVAAGIPVVVAGVAELKSHWLYEGGE